MTRPRGPSWPAVLVLSVTAACGVTQRPSVKMVDPALREQGTALERTRSRGAARGGFMLGPYLVRDVSVRSQAPDPDGPLAREDVPRPVTQHRASVVLEAPQTQRAWTAVCTLQRRAPAHHDFHAVLDENGDEVAVECTAKATGTGQERQPPWRFTARTLLSSNFVGVFAPEGVPEADSKTAPTLEMLTRATHFKRLERVLPVPVAQLRHGGDAQVAMLLGRPERAWVADGVDPMTAEAALALMTTLSLLPWELAE